MKILHVMAGAEHGGAETFFSDSLVALHEKNISQYVVTRNNNDFRTGLVESCGIPLKTASFNRLFRFPTTQAITKAHKEYSPDITQYWMSRAGEFGIPSKGVNVAWYGGYYKPFRYQHADVHVAVTRDIADHIIGFGVDASKVHVLHTYAEFEDSKPLSRAEFNTPDGVPLLLALSRLHWKKGLDILLIAMLQVPDAFLWIAGSGPLDKDLKKLCADLGLEDRVRFLGWRNDRGSLLATADICVFPSRYEPFGTVTVEAWGHHVPLVAAKAAGPKAYITHEKDGLLVDIDDVQGLSCAINRIIKDPALAQSLKVAGYETYKKGFCKAVYQKNAMDFYEALLQAKDHTIAPKRANALA